MSTSIGTLLTSISTINISSTHEPHFNQSLILVHLETTTVPLRHPDGVVHIQHRHSTLGISSNYFWLLGLAVLACVVVVYVLWSRLKHYRYEKLNRLLDDDNAPYIYKPLQGGVLDEQYENTFVGVSVPLLQDNTKL